MCVMSGFGLREARTSDYGRDSGHVVDMLVLQSILD
jgi:hypothetical protein